VRRDHLVMRPGTEIRRLRIVLAATGPVVPSLREATQRIRLWAKAASTTHAAFAVKIPEVQWFPAEPSFRSRMAGSTTAWRR
jgi:hypothetical protein